MSSTIAVKEGTLEMLRQLQQHMNTESHDETIRKLILQARTPKRSMFGALKGVKREFVREEIDRFA